MKKVIFVLALSMGITSLLNAQKYFTKEGKIHFFSATTVENIEATSNTATCVLDAATGDVEWSVLVKGFKFEKALMEEHFNENYMESNTFPKATFKGKADLSSVNLKKDGTYKTKVSGDLTIHGVTKPISTDATFTVAGGKITSDSKTYVNPKDFNITIPAAVKEKISDKIEVTVNATLAELKK